MFETVLQRWQPAAAVLGFAFFFLWESLSPFFAPRSRLKHIVRNLTITAMNVALLAIVFGALTAFAAAHTESERMGLLYTLPVTGTIRALGAFLLLDFWQYWWHRANHRIAFLWRFHRMHHSDPEVDVSTATRFHAGEITISATIRLGLIPLLGISLTPLFAYDLLLLLSTQFHHANLALPGPADRLIRAVIVTPFMHKIHHSTFQSETDSNYTSILSVWDRLFGSFRLRENYAALRFGLAGFDRPEKQTIKGLLLTPLD